MLRYLHNLVGTITGFAVVRVPTFVLGIAVRLPVATICRIHSFLLFGVPWHNDAQAHTANGAMHVHCYNVSMTCRIMARHGRQQRGRSTCRPTNSISSLMLFRNSNVANRGDIRVKLQLLDALTIGMTTDDTLPQNRDGPTAPAIYRVEECMYVFRILRRSTVGGLLRCCCCVGAS
jgi:hypothetical protein